MTQRRNVLHGLLAVAGVAPIMKLSMAYAQSSLATSATSVATMNTRRFDFVSAGVRLSGFVDTPAAGAAQALIVILHGYGKTDVAGHTSYYDLRSRFTQLGITTVIWDKPGCGKSEGSFNINQPIESSAREVQEAIQQIRRGNVAGVQKIGLWGISRAGWIAPLAIEQDPSIAFWISVSGTDDKETFPYLLESKFRIEGRTEQEIKRLVGEWRRGFGITSRGGTFQDYLAATRNLRRDPFIMYLSGGSGDDEASFHRAQKRFLNGAAQVDKETGLEVYVPHFQNVLSRLNVPVLAIFGEMDRSVNWRSTVALYSRTLGNNPRAKLTVRSFPDGNHNIQQAKTGGLREMLEMKERLASVGYFEVIEKWLRAEVLN